MFSSQTVPADPRYSHSFAAFVELTDCGSGQPVLRSHVISWLPQSLDIRLFTLFPEPGVNLGLQATLRYVLDNGERVSMWGPYRIEKELYDRAMARIQELESGSVQYKTIDTGYSPARVSNCIHAIGEIVGGARVRVASPGWGETASYALLLRMERWILDDRKEHPWIEETLGLNDYPIIRRDYDRRFPMVRRGFSNAAVGPRP
ncbi:MAG: hypothetical protein HYS12_23465 [Planctomycetes bacterium]|nr:hypothetical protein [Planctomycetota bacterium]